MARGWMSALIVVALASCADDGKTTREGGGADGGPVTYTGARRSLGGITVKVPEAWASRPPTSSMRVAQYQLPGVEGEAEMVVFHFGAGSAGSVDMNLDRWRGQIKADDGSQGQVSKHEVNGMPVTVLDVAGTYSPSMGPMMQPGAPVPDTRMVAAIVESPTGAYYFKLTGPKATVGHWRETFAAFVNSAEKL